MSRLGRKEKPWEKFCAEFTNRPIAPQQFQEFRFQVLKQRVGQLVTHDTLLKPFHSDWETMEISDEAQQQWDTAFPGDIENRRLAHYLNAFAIDADDSRKVSASSDPFLPMFLATTPTRWNWREKNGSVRSTTDRSTVASRLFRKR